MNTPIISQEDMAKLLGRSLSTTEINAYDLYLEIAVKRLEDLLCLTLPKALKEVDLKLLLARCFATISVENSLDGANVSSKKVEDFQINYDTSSTDTPMAKFYRNNASVIAKYSECQGRIRNGVVHGHCVRCI